MDETYQIFKKLPEGAVWVESVTGLDKIDERLKSLNDNNPGEYFAYDIHEGRIVAQIAPRTRKKSA